MAAMIHLSHFVRLGPAGRGSATRVGSAGIDGGSTGLGTVAISHDWKSPHTPFIAVAGKPFQIELTHRVTINLSHIGQCQHSLLSNAYCSDYKIEIQPQ